jgi:hypothetical protein
MTYSEMIKEVHLYACNNRDDLVHAVVRSAFRTIFDPHCSEWDSTSIDEKMRFLKIVKGFSFTLEELVVEYQAMWKEHHRPDIANVVDDALERIK